jgi:hypothetical protein
MPEQEEKSPDYSKDSAEDRAEDAPSGKEAVTEEDEELAEDQTAFQTDSS